MNRLVIVGAGGFGRGVYSWVKQSPDHRNAHNIDQIVFVDDRSQPTMPETTIVSTIADYKPRINDLAICAIGSPKVRRAIVTQLKSKDANFHTFVDDNSSIGEGVQLGAGTVVCPRTTISAHAQLGSHVHVNFNCAIGHDTRIDSFTTLSPMVNIMGEVIVGGNVFFGGSSTVLPRLTVGTRAIVGAGAVATNNIEADQVVIGVPAQPTRRN